MAQDLRIGYLSTLYHTSFILKGSHHTERNLGLRIAWRLFPSGPAMIEAFERGEIDLGYMGLPPAMIGIGRGLKIKCVAGGHVEGTVLVGAGGCCAMNTAKDTLAQFSGKAIGTPGAGSIHDIILRRLIDESGFHGEIAVKNYEWADFILDALLDGEIDGGCGTPSLAVLAVRRMGARIVLPPSMMWPWNPSYGIIATEGLIQNSPSLLLDFLELHEDACKLLRENPKETAGLVHSVMRVIDEGFALEVIEISPKYCAAIPNEYIESSMAFVPALREMGYLTRELETEDVFFTGAIKRVHPGRHHYDIHG